MPLDGKTPSGPLAAKWDNHIFDSKLVNPANKRKFGGAQVSRTFYARGQTGQQLLLGAYQALCRQIGLGSVEMFPRTEMLDLVIVDGQAKGIVMRNLTTGEITSHAGDAVVLAT